VAAARDAEAARIAGRDFDLDGALAQEFANVGVCRAVSAVNAAEADLLRAANLPNVTVIGTMRMADPTEPGFEARDGLLFVAGIHETDSPNLDALRWYAEAIGPALAELLPEPPVLTVAGHISARVDLAEFADNPHLRLIGPVDELRSLYARHRLFIAPTRYAAGTPYKLYEAASYGLPAVATDLLVRQLGWSGHREIVAAPRDDAAAFAAAIAKLYHSETRWRALRKAALARVERENNPSGFTAEIRAMLAHITAPRTALPQVG
jgi:glycosyltransferase involved in cell wall biosynthesis